MKKKTYIYKLTSKYRKHPELLLDYGFQYYESEDKDASIFAIPITLKTDNPLFIQCVRFLEHIYSEATTEERERDFEGYEFKKELQVNQQNVDRLVLTESVVEELSAAQLCVSISKRDEDKSLLFINSPIQNAYYHFETIRECAPELIDKMLEEKVIYKKAHRYNADK